MYSIDYFKTEPTQMRIGQVICIHGQYPCSLWYVKNIEDDDNQEDDYEYADENLDQGLATLYEIEYDGTSYYPKMNTPKIVQIYISNIKYTIISNASIICQFPLNYIQLYHLQRVHNRAPSFGDMIQLKYYDAFMPFMVINYSPVDKAHFVMSLHTSRVFKTYHLILELSEYNIISTKELRYSIITSQVNKGYSLELQKLDSGIEVKTRGSYLFDRSMHENMDMETYDFEDIVSQSIISNDLIHNPTTSMEFYYRSSNDNSDTYDSTSDDDYTDSSVSPRLPIYIPAKMAEPVETPDSLGNEYIRQDCDRYTDEYSYNDNQTDKEDEYQNDNNQYYEDEEDEYQTDNNKYCEDEEDEYQTDNNKYCEDEEDEYQTDNNQYYEDEDEDEEDAEDGYRYEYYNYIDNKTQYNADDYDTEDTLTNKEIKDTQPNQDTDIKQNIQEQPASIKINETVEETYSFFTDDIINEVKSFFNEDTKKEIDEFLNDKEVIEAGNAIKHAVSEVISYLQTVSEPTEDLTQTSHKDTSIEEDKGNKEIVYDDIIVINNDDILDDVSINEAPTPCSIM